MPNEHSANARPREATLIVASDRFTSPAADRVILTQNSLNSDRKGGAACIQVACACSCSNSECGHDRRRTRQSTHHNGGSPCVTPFHLAALLAACCTLAAAGTAAGQCDVYRLGVPDFDQRPCNLFPAAAASFCCPTSTSNWFAYISNNGYPDVFLGPRTGSRPRTTTMRAR